MCSWGFENALLSSGAARFSVCLHLRILSFGLFQKTCSEGADPYENDPVIRFGYGIHDKENEQI